MRRVNVSCILMAVLGTGFAGKAVAQGRAPALRDSGPPAAAVPDTQSVKAPPLPPWMQNRPAGEAPGIGPRLPVLVSPVTTQVAANQPLAPAPRGNIVIPVTTALIVLTVLVVILLID